MSSDFIVRKAVPDDAEKILAMLRPIHAEPINNMRRDIDELDFTIEQERETIQKFSENPNSLFIVAEDNDGNIIGVSTCDGGKYRAEKHTAEFGISIAEGWRGKGVGSAMIDYMLKWARGAGLKRISLFVFARNDGAIRLYERYGWQIEGRLRNDMYRNGEYLDTLIMGLLLD